MDLRQYRLRFFLRFITLFSRFHRTQGLVCGRKVGSNHLKCHLDPAAYVLPGEINSVEKCTGCNEEPATLSGEVDVRFIVRFSTFHCTQGLVCGRTVGSNHLKHHLVLAAWVLPDEINSLEMCAGCKEALATVSVEVDVRFIALFSCFHRTQGPVCERTVGSKNQKHHHDQSEWVLPDEKNSMENGACFNERLVTVSGEIDVRVIAHFSRFHRTQCPVCRRNVGSITRNVTY